jgi:hypothetical protein
MKLKDLFTSTPILQHVKSEHLIIIVTDVSNFIIRAILLQIQNGCLQHVAVYLWMLYKPELNYEIHKTKILVIISAFKE